MLISVYDDDILERNMMICHIKSYYYGRNPLVIVREFGSKDLLDKNIGANIPDITLICQDGGQGIQTARHIRDVCKACALVLISDTPQYGMEAYNLNAAHYLVKPVGYSHLCEALARCEKQK